ncbi:MAG: GNAT family N-acetyltransferase, partial [Tepidiformaceae bacterium]
MEGRGIRLEPLQEDHVASGVVLGSTRYHDIIPAVDRVEIGYTWYRQSRQRTNVNTTCK